MLHLVIDSVSYAEKEFIEEHGITRVPLSFTLEGVTEEEGLPGSFDDFFRRFSESEEFPTTSQPPSTEFQRVFDKLTENGDEVICITMSSKLSGTNSSANMAAKASRSELITVIDSLGATGTQYNLVEVAVKGIKEGKSREEIVEEIYKARDELTLYILPGTLDYLRKGGRIGKASALIGNILHMVPILEVVDGEVDVDEKIRGKKKALRRLIEKIPPDARWIQVHHILAPDKADEIYEALKISHPEAEIKIGEIGPILGIHVGPGSSAVSFK